jgi:predicted  nucleic acid-binding Zn-ribbon protein
LFEALQQNEIIVEKREHEKNSRITELIDLVNKKQEEITALEDKLISLKAENNALST